MKESLASLVREIFIMHVAALAFAVVLLVLGVADPFVWGCVISLGASTGMLGLAVIGIARGDLL